MARPKVPLISKHQVVRKALEIVDSEGMDALTIRRLGKELNVNGASLYHHFANKEEILLAVGRTVLREIDIPEDSDDGIEWIVEASKNERRVLLDHPETVHLLGQGYLRIHTVPGYARTREILAELGVRRSRHEDAIEMIQSLCVGSVVMRLIPNKTDADEAELSQRKTQDARAEAVFEKCLRALLAQFPIDYPANGQR